MKHYLITVPLGARNIHAYVMAENDDKLPAVYNKLLELGDPMMPVILQTILSTGIETVREIICKDEKVKNTLNAAKDFHLTIFATHESNPDDQILMDMH